jgi:hypothetical protein
MIAEACRGWNKNWSNVLNIPKNWSNAIDIPTGVPQGIYGSDLKELTIIN